MDFLYMAALWFVGAFVPIAWGLTVTVLLFKIWNKVKTLPG